jgi:phosphodiesterase/alkaline phosphatase D-like protein
MRVIFASCADYRKETEYEVWKQIEGEQPDVLLLLGDNVYLPKDVDPYEIDMLQSSLEQQYDRLLSDPNFNSLKTFMANGDRPMAALYDDHDSIGEDTRWPELTLEMRKAVQSVFFHKMKFASVGDTLYRTFIVGLVRFVMLDTRSYRTHEASTLDDLLGSNQTDWLRSELSKNSPTRYTLICSGITFHRYGLLVSAGWFFHPDAKNELHALIADKSGYLFLSGDIHDNHLKEKKGVIEAVSSGVARKPLGGGNLLRNYGVIDFAENEVKIRLVSNEPAQNFERTIAFSDWTL